MPRRGKYPYMPSSLQQAIHAVTDCGLTVRSAARRFNIPRSTLQFKLKNPDAKSTKGPNPILTATEERTLVKWIFECARKGFPINKQDLQNSVQHYLKDKEDRAKIFTNGKPGDGWYKAFLKRNPSLSLRTSEAVTSASACVSEADIRKWFAEVNNYIKEKGLEDVIANPERVFNGDESNFQICPKTGKVLAEKGSRNVYDIERGASKENLTVMFTFAASGEITPPMVIYPYQRIPAAVIQQFPKTWGLGKSDNGWMKAEVFYEYIANVLHPYLISQNIAFPVILFLDGHTTHLTFEVSELCAKLKIELIALYPNATRILQPADVSAFRPIKAAWRNAVREWKRENPEEVLTKTSFATVLQKVFLENCKRDTLKNGFKICGLCPFNPDAVDYSKCHGGVGQMVNSRANPVNEEAVLTFDKFKDIVGREMVERFQRLPDSLEQEQGNEEFFVLFQVWEHFHKNRCSDADNNQLNRDLNEAVVAQPAMDDAIATSNSVEMMETGINEERSLFDDRLGQSEISCAEITIASANSENQIDLNSATSVELDRSLRVVNHSEIGKYLAWPHTPKRKGKRNVERLPYAISSIKYREMCKAKEEKKQKIEDDKIERKRKREQRKEAIQKKKPQSVKARNIQHETSQKTNNYDIAGCSRNLFGSSKTLSGPMKTASSNVAKKIGIILGVCNKCNSSAKEKVSVVCNDCRKIFHHRCVPKDHQQYLPEGKGEIFLCHECFHLESDTEYGSDLSVEDEVSRCLTDICMEMNIVPRKKRRENAEK